MLNTTEIDEAVRALPYDPPKDSAARNAWRTEREAKINALQTEWKAWLEVEYASDIPAAVRPEIFRKAWEDGHSAGYSEIESQYQELSSFARSIIAAEWAERDAAAFLR